MKQLLAEHGVAVLPGQDVDDQQFLEFLGRFGRLTFTQGETPVPGFGDLNVISNVGRTTPPRSVFHVDTSYVRNPPAYTALRAVQVPRRGGQTQFTNQYRAYETLPPEVRDRLRGLKARHVVSGLDTADLAETQAEHPLLRRHPVSGRTSLYLSTPQRCREIGGLEPDEATQLIEFLYRHSTAPANVLAHSWAAGDVVIWDNRVVLHRADHSGVEGERVMHRGMVTA
nr:TauD/TfdA family dioxygenase [Kineosporia rhizophila]